MKSNSFLNNKRVNHPRSLVRSKYNSEFSIIFNTRIFHASSWHTMNADNEKPNEEEEKKILNKKKKKRRRHSMCSTRTHSVHDRYTHAHMYVNNTQIFFINIFPSAYTHTVYFCCRFPKYKFSNHHHQKANFVLLLLF